MTQRKKTALFFNFIFLLTVISNSSHAQLSDVNSKAPNTRFFNPNIYSILQIQNKTDPEITSIFWIYTKKLYFEAHYNYEERRTFSLSIGKSFKLGKKKELEIIPMLGGGIGQFNGILPSLSLVYEGQNIRGSSQSQYLITLEKYKINQFSNWTQIGHKIYKKVFLGVSDIITIPNNGTINNLFSPAISIKTRKFIFEGYAYNFWDNPLWAIGMQYNFTR